MDKEKFDAIFNECVDSLTPHSVEDINQKIKLYGENPDKISATNLAMFAYLESMDYSRKLIYSFLSKVLEVED